MSTTVSYKGSTIATVSNDTKTLLTEGKYLEDDITLVDVSGGGATLITKNISANGTYNASSDSADGYSQVTVAVPASAVDSGTKNITANGNNQDVVGYAAVNVNVPNTYSAGDEGKVVSSGALVAQTSDTVTTNDTYDTTLINSLTVNVSGGGGNPNENMDKYLNGTLTSYKTDVSWVHGYSFRSATIQTLVLTNLDATSTQQMFSYSGFQTIDISGGLSNIPANTFHSSSSLAILILRNSSVVGLGNTSAFNNTKYASGGTGGTLYVPNDLITSYQSASNWGTILGYTNNQIKSIESTHTDPTAPIDLTLYYADGTPIS